MSKTFNKNIKSTIVRIPAIHNLVNNTLSVNEFLFTNLAVNINKLAINKKKDISKGVSGIKLTSVIDNIAISERSLYRLWEKDKIYCIKKGKPAHFDFNLSELKKFDETLLYSSRTSREDKGYINKYFLKGHINIPFDIQKEIYENSLSFSAIKVLMMILRRNYGSDESFLDIYKYFNRFTQLRKREVEFGLMELQFKNVIVDIGKHFYHRLYKIEEYLVELEAQEFRIEDVGESIANIF